VEVVNRVFLKVLKSMLSERKLKTVEWTKVIAWVQSSLIFLLTTTEPVGS
jgi:hypothetical protein